VGWVKLVVGTYKLMFSTGMYRAEHMVEGEKVVKAEVLNRSPIQLNSGWISPKFSLRIRDANLHDAHLPTGSSCARLVR
jgi:hypothetical protein